MSSRLPPVSSVAFSFGPPLLLTLQGLQLFCSSLWVRETTAYCVAQWCQYLKHSYLQALNRTHESGSLALWFCTITSFLSVIKHRKLTNFCVDIHHWPHVNWFISQTYNLLLLLNMFCCHLFNCCLFMLFLQLSSQCCTFSFSCCWQPNFHPRINKVSLTTHRELSDE